MVTILITTYGAILIAELVGDRTLYTLCAIVSRYRPLPVLMGAAMAFMGKMAVAVLLGGLIASLPGWVSAAISGLTFLTMAVFVWRATAEAEPANEFVQRGSAHAALVGFTSIFFTEWGDVGQITAALLAARYHRPGIVWMGATAALMTKAIFAVTLGMGLRRWIPRKPLRITAVSLLFLMGAFAFLRVE